VRTVARDSHDPFDRRFRDMEALRLTGLLVEWAEIEKGRSPFEVAASERERSIEVGGLQLTARIDRVDRLPDGRVVVLDYKTTAPSPAAWAGERPDEPQLPLYAISSDMRVAAVAFAHAGAGDQRFRGCAASDGILPGVKGADDLDDQIAQWRITLDSLARAFREGTAPADPKKGAATCNECGLTALCRIHEVEPGDEA
jgi:RecB family exonuclease